MSLDRNSESDDDIDDNFNLPCKEIGHMRMLNSELKASQEKFRELVTADVVLL